MLEKFQRIIKKKIYKGMKRAGAEKDQGNRRGKARDVMQIQEWVEGKQLTAGEEEDSKGSGRDGSRKRLA